MKNRFIFLLGLLFCLLVVPMASASSNLDDLNSATVAYWSFDEGSGITASDSSGNGNTANLLNGYTWVSDGVFDNVGVRTDDTPNSAIELFNSRDVTESFTLSVWAKPMSTSQRSMTWFNPISWGGGIITNHGGTNQIGFNHRESTNSISQVSINNYDINDGDFHLFTSSYNANTGEIKLWVNDELVGTGTAGTITGSTQFILGANLDSGSGTNRHSYHTYSGTAFFNRELSSEEVEFLYANGNPTEEQQYPYGGGNFFVTARDSFDNSPISNFSILMSNSTITLNLSTTNGIIDTGVLSNVSSLFNITVSSNQSGGYFSREYFNLNISTNLVASLVKWTRINAESIFDSTPINMFTVNFEGEEYSTNNGDVFIPLFNTTAEVSINAPGYAIQTQTLTANPYLTNYTFRLFNQNTFDIVFYDETSNQLLDNINIIIEFISELQAFNATTSNGTYFVDLLIPGDYQIRYRINSSDEVIRSFFTTLTPQSIQELRLYLIDEDISTFYVARAVDASGSACQENKVSLLRYYVEGNAYRVVEMSRTDSQGQALFRVRPNTIDYKLLFSGSCGVYQTPPTRFIDPTNTYTIIGSQTILESLTAIPSVQTSLEFIELTNTFVYTWNSPTNIVSGGCLEVTKRMNGIRTLFNKTCSSGMTGSIPITIDSSLNETVWFASGTINTNTQFSTYNTNNLEISFLTGLFQISNVMPFISLILFLAIVLFFGTSAPTLIIGTIAALLLVSSFLFLSISWGVLSSLIVLAGIILYSLRRV